MPDIKKIREAVEKNCGGFEASGDAAIMSKWNSLPKEVQEKYLKTLTTTLTTENTKKTK